MKPVVLQLIDSFHQGGSERQALQLTRLLHESGKFQIRLASLSPEGSLQTTIADMQLGDIPSFPLTSFYDQNAVKQLRRFTRFLKSERIKILHTHDFYTNIFGMAGGALARVPVRIASMRETAGMRSRAQKNAQRLAYALAHHVVANSAAVKQRLLEVGVKADKVTIIYNGLDSSRLNTRAPRAEVLASLCLNKNGTRTNTRFVTIVANMRHEVKDYPMFLRSARRVLDKVPEAAFLLAGEGQLTESLRAMSREIGIDSRTYFLGRCENVAELLSISDVCVLSSKAEGLSNSILEYMAAARPVVATAVGGAGEVIEEGRSGYLVSSGDDETMADRIVSLLKDPVRAREFGSVGQQIVNQNFSCEAQLRRTEELYERLLSRS